MTKYYVGIPMTAEVGFYVEADSEEEAIEIAFGMDFTMDDIVNSELHDSVTRGNVCSAVLNNVYAQKEDRNDK